MLEMSQGRNSPKEIILTRHISDLGFDIFHNSCLKASELEQDRKSGDSESSHKFNCWYGPHFSLGRNLEKDGGRRGEVGGLEQIEEQGREEG